MGADLAEFEGTQEEKQVAETAYRLMVAQGAMFATDAPIKQSLANLAEYLARSREGETVEDMAALVDRALSRNSGVFHREEVNGDVVFVTSKRGRYMPRMETGVDTEHRLKTRLYEPRPEDLIQRKPKPAPVPAEETPAEIMEEAEETRLAPHLIPEEIVEAEEVEAPEEVAAPVMLAVAPGVAVDLSLPTPDITAQYGDYFKKALGAALADDFRFVSFGKEIYLEELVARFSKGDLRRIKEYIIESNEPLPDTALLADALGKRATDPDYEAMRFSLNYRLLREKKDFEFVGVEDERLWSVSDLPPIGVQRKKASEIGQELRHLSLAALSEESLPPDAIQEAAEGKRLTHVLTYWDHENGLLPYDRATMELLPKPLVEEQRAIILHFEAPQTYTLYLGELRLPTSNRGGWIAGLDGFMEENLVPGAKVIFTSTDKQNYFLVDFVKTSPKQDDLLHFDEKKGRFVFRPATYSCEVEPRMLLSESRFPRLAGTKRLDETDRRRVESVVAWAFRMVGEEVTQDGAQVYLAFMDDLLPVVNIEKPFSENRLRQILLSKTFSQFSADTETEGAFYYRPAKG